MNSTSIFPIFDWPNDPMEAAAIVGHTTESTTRLWFRTGYKGSFILFVYLFDDTLQHYGGNLHELSNALWAANTPAQIEAALHVVCQNEIEIKDFSTDTTHVECVEGLAPNTSYGYVLYSVNRNTVLLGDKRLKRFRTAPEEPNQNQLSFVLFSCHKPYSNQWFKKKPKTVNLDMLQLLAERWENGTYDIDFVIAAGDQAYSDGLDSLDIWKHLNRKLRTGNVIPSYERMCDWYREIYRGYWGFEQLQRVFDTFPTYMIWDDHEIYNGWGSYYLRGQKGEKTARSILPNLWEWRRRIPVDGGRCLVHRMFLSAKQAYFEYQHSHNPPTNEGIYDYGFCRSGSAFYVLDGRGHRDIERNHYRILGQEQFERFAAWLDQLDPSATPFLFVISAVPVLHIEPGGYKERLSKLFKKVDMRDSWMHNLHGAERRQLMCKLFEASKSFKVSVLSGDRHISAAFSLEDGCNGKIYQLTSSPITHEVNSIYRWLLKKVVGEGGSTPEGYNYQRLALYDKVSYAKICVDPTDATASFKLYSRDGLEETVDLFQI